MTDTRVPRFDRGPLVRLTTDAPTPDMAPAVVDKDGYLVATAWIARDGLLEYSDGETSWIEYRPREELEKAAASFEGVPITDEHPATMVTAETHDDVCRGIVLQGVRVVDHLGVAYLEARLSIRSAELIERVQNGDQAECSIGFTARVTPVEGVAADGTPCDAVQSELEGNHNAQVTEGRAGPVCKVYLDGAQVLVPTMTRSHMATKTKGDNAAAPPAPPPKKDESGAPTETLPYMLPSGEEVQLPSVVVSMLQELEQMKATPQAPAATPPQPMTPPPPAMDAEEEEKTMDAKTYARRRAKLERTALRWGVSEDKLDAEDDVLGRELIAKAMPHLEGKLDSVKGERLDALVEAASMTPLPEAQGDALDELEGAYTRQRGDSKVSAEEREQIEYLRKAGFC